MLGENLKQVVVDVILAHIAETKGNHARQSGAGGSNKLAELEVMGHKNSVLSPGKVQNRRIVHRREPTLR